MIKTLDEYNSSKAYIDTSLELYDYTLSERMNSEEYNLFLQDTEYYFNILYEKLRTLEDLVDYMDFYCTSKIESANNLILEKEQVIGNLKNELENVASIAVPVIWDASPLKTEYDRDGSALATSTLTRAYEVTSKYILSNELKIKNFTKCASELCYFDNLSTCIKEGFYMAEYRLGKPDVVKELIEVETEGAPDFDFFDYETINCSLEYIGINDSGNIVFQLVADAMTKDYNLFDYSMFKNSGLDTTVSAGFRAKAEATLTENTLALCSVLNASGDEKYIGEAADFWNRKADTTEKNRKLNDSNQ